MTVDDKTKKIENLIKQGEDETVEFKTSFADGEDILKTICAFANGKGGHLVIGVRDDGTVTGVSVNRKILDKLENSVRENIEPRIYVDISILAIDHKNVVHVKVPEGINKPYFYRGRCYIRIGSVTRQVGRDGIIKILKSKISFDNIKLDEKIEIDNNIVLELVRRARAYRRMKITIGRIEDILKKLGLYKKRANGFTVFRGDSVSPSLS